MRRQYVEQFSGLAGNVGPTVSGAVLADEGSSLFVSRVTGDLQVFASLNNLDAIEFIGVSHFFDARSTESAWRGRAAHELRCDEERDFVDESGVEEPSCQLRAALN